MPVAPPKPVLSGTVIALIVGSLAVFAIALVAVFVIGPIFESPDRHDEARYGRVYVRVGDEWSQESRRRIGEAVAHLSRLGPTFVVSRQSETAPSGRMVVLRRGEWSTRDTAHPSSLADACRQEGAGHYLPNSTEVWVDPGCAPGEQLVTTTMHEIGHWLGMGHVCRDAMEPLGTTCSPVGQGFAFMNPSVAYGEEEIGFDRAASMPVPTILPTPLDHAEFARAWPGFRRRWGEGH